MSGLIVHLDEDSRPTKVELDGHDISRHVRRDGLTLTSYPDGRLGATLRLTADVSIVSDTPQRETPPPPPPDWGSRCSHPYCMNDMRGSTGYCTEHGSGR